MGQFQVPLWIHGHRCQGANAVCEPSGTLLGRSDMASTMVRKLVSELVVAADRFCKPILQALFDVVINDGLLAPKGG